MEVEIICGGYGHRAEGTVNAKLICARECCEVSDDEGHRLISLGVAKEVLRAVATPHGGEESGGQGETTPEGDEGAEGADGGNLPASAEPLDIVDGHFTVESLMEMTRTNMEKLAAFLNVDISKCKNKPDIAAALSAVEVYLKKPEEDGETPPDLGVAPPVV